ncbi:MAG: porin [Sulfuriferula sp.]
MNKKLIALAIAGAFAAPLAMADNGNVTIYGEFAGSVDSVDGGSYSPVVATTPKTGGINAATTERRTRVSSNNSFIGFKGSEDLGNGLSAIWQFEQSIAIDQQNKNDTAGVVGAGNQSHRTTFVGLASKQMGTVQLGLIDTPFKTSLGPLDAFGQHTLADYRSIIGMVGGANLGSFRAQNAVQYVSPKMGGFFIKALYSAANEAGNDTGNATTGAVTGLSNPHLYSISGTYASGPLYGVLAYEDIKSVTSSTVDFHYKNWRAGAAYKFGDLKIGLGFERIDGDGNVAVGSANTISRNAWYVPVTYAMGNNTLKLAFTKAGSSNQKSAAGADLSGSDGAKQWSLGVDHNFSKRTKLYALYTRVNNDSNGSYTLGGGATGISEVALGSYGGTSSGFSVGMVHAF